MYLAIILPIENIPTFVLNSESVSQIFFTLKFKFEISFQGKSQMVNHLFMDDKYIESNQ